MSEGPTEKVEYQTIEVVHKPESTGHVEEVGVSMPDP